MAQATVWLATLRTCNSHCERQEKSPITQKPAGLQAWLESRQALWPQAWRGLSLEDVTSRFLSDHAFRWEFGAQPATEQSTLPAEGFRAERLGSGVWQPLGFLGRWRYRGLVALPQTCWASDRRYWGNQTIYDWLRDDMSGGKANELLPASGPTIDAHCNCPSLSMSAFEGGQARMLLLSVQKTIVG